MAFAMSRKRQQRKAKHTELARQLGVSRGDLADAGQALTAKGRVGQLVVRCQSLEVLEEAGAIGRVLGKRPLRAVAVAAFLVDGHGASSLGAARWTFGDGAKGAPLLPIESAKLEAKPRYERPAHFVIVLAATEADADLSEALSSDGLQLLSASGDAIGVDDDNLADAAWETPRIVGLGRAGGALDGILGAAAVSVPGVHRARHALAFPLTTPGGRYLAHLEVRI